MKDSPGSLGRALPGVEITVADKNGNPAATGEGEMMVSSPRTMIGRLPGAVDVIGVDLSRRAIALARAAYKRRQESGIPLAGSASFHAGDIRSVFHSRAGQRVHAFFSNRVLHLLSQRIFATRCMRR